MGKVRKKTKNVLLEWLEDEYVTLVGKNKEQCIKILDACADLDAWLNAYAMFIIQKINKYKKNHETNVKKVEDAITRVQKTTKTEPKRKQQPFDLSGETELLFDLLETSWFEPARRFDKIKIGHEQYNKFIDYLKRNFSREVSRTFGYANYGIDDIIEIYKCYGKEKYKEDIKDVKELKGEINKTVVDNDIIDLVLPLMFFCFVVNESNHFSPGYAEKLYKGIRKPDKCNPDINILKLVDKNGKSKIDKTWHPAYERLLEYVVEVSDSEVFSTQTFRRDTEILDLLKLGEFLATYTKTIKQAQLLSELIVQKIMVADYQDEIVLLRLFIANAMSGSLLGKMFVFLDKDYGNDLICNDYPNWCKAEVYKRLSKKNNQKTSSGEAAETDTETTAESAEAAEAETDVATEADIAAEAEKIFCKTERLITPLDLAMNNCLMTAALCALIDDISINPAYTKENITKWIDSVEQKTRNYKKRLLRKNKTTSDDVLLGMAEEIKLKCMEIKDNFNQLLKDTGMEEYFKDAEAHENTEGTEDTKDTKDTKTIEVAKVADDFIGKILNRYLMTIETDCVIERLNRTLDVLGIIRESTNAVVRGLKNIDAEFANNEEIIDSAREYINNDFIKVIDLLDAE